MSAFDQYLRKRAVCLLMRCPEKDLPHTIFINEDTFVPNVLPRSGAGITLKAGEYIR